MQNVKRKPMMVNLVAALVMCLVTFIIGFTISSFVLLDSRLESAHEKNSELGQTIDEKKTEIKELNALVEQKSKENVLLGEKIADQATTIEALKKEVSGLEEDVSHISEAALGTSGVTGSVFAVFSALSISQQLIFVIILFVILVLIISITCVLISHYSAGRKLPLPDEPVEEIVEEKPLKKRRRREKPVKAPEEKAFEEENEEKSEEALEEAPASEDEEQPPVSEEKKLLPPPAVSEALKLLYHNELEASISQLGGFKFGVTNFDEILSDKAHGKAFGNTESGDFVAFLSNEEDLRRLYIIPRHLALSDSTVALRGVTDLFNIYNSQGPVTSGAVRIKAVTGPAVFIFGEKGWTIEKKGELSVFNG